MIGRDETGTLGDGDEGAYVVKQVDEEEDKDDLEGADVKGSAEIEVKGGGADGGEVEGSGVPVDLVTEYAEEHGAEDADEHGGADAEDLKDGDEEQTEESKRGLRGAEVAEGDRGCGAGDDDAGVAEADEGDEEANAAADGSVELMGYGGDQTLAYTGEGEQEEDDSGEEDGSECGLPGDTHFEDNGIGEVSVQAHAWSEC